MEVPIADYIIKLHKQFKQTKCSVSISIVICMYIQIAPSDGEIIRFDHKQRTPAQSWTPYLMERWL